jgi:aminoglycoside phosphotransferase (APT) family kinase protein
VSEAVPRRDPVETARALERWLGRRLDATSVTVVDLTTPKAGFSNETIIGRAAWVDASGEHERDVVVRIEPTAHQLFVEPDALRQAHVMSLLAGQVPVPHVWCTEADQSVLGAPFFLMDRVDGRIPGDVPSWHKRGWTTELDAAARHTLHDNALGALVRLHAVDTAAPAFTALEPPADPARDGGTALQRYVTHLATWYRWCRPVVRYGVDTIEAALHHVTTQVPDDDRRRVVWGDARVGNIVFADDLSVAALLDWEGASLGPPEIDVAWWVMFDEFLCEAQGLPRLAGVPDRAGTYARYEELAGAPLCDIVYYEVLVGLQLALINSRLADLLITSGKVPEAVAAEYVTRVTGMTQRSLDRIEGGAR